MSERETATANPEQIFVGRTREMDRLKGVLGHAISDEGRMVMLVGEPGIGKTRTAEEFAGIAEEQDVEVLWGRCYEGEGAPLYWPWMEVIRGYLHNHEAEEVRQYMESGATAIAEMVPHVAEHLGELPEMKPLDDPVSARFRMFDSTTTFLKNASSARPIMLVLDDLHWADGPSLLLVEFLAHRLGETKVLVVGTYRDVEVRRTHPLQQTLGDLTRERLFEKVLLRGLDQEAVKEYVEEASGAAGTAELSEAVYTQSEGNPLFMSETVRLLVEERELAPDISARGVGRSARIPDGIREVIGRRLSRLSGECNRVLTTASVVGREFGLDILKVLMDDLTEDRLLEVLEEALEVRVVEEQPESYGRYRFNHALTQQTLIEELSMTRQARLHASIAEAMEKVYGEEAGAHAIELVEHFANAETVLGSEKPARYLLLAGEKSLDAYAHEQALEYFKRGVEIKEGSPMDEETADLWFGLGRAQTAMLDEGNLDSLRKAFDYYEKENNKEKMVAVASIPFFWWVLGSRDWLEQACERCLALVQDDSPAAGSMLAKLAGWRYWDRGDYDKACGAFERALEIARENEDIGLEMQTLALWGWVAYDAHRYEEAKERGESALALARELGDLRAEAEALLAIGNTLSRLGDPRMCEYYEKRLEVAERLRDRGLLVSAYYSAGLVAMKRAEFTRAHELFTHAKAIVAARYSFGTRFMAIAFETGKVEEGHEWVDRELADLRGKKADQWLMGNLCHCAVKTRDRRLLDIVKSLAEQGFEVEGASEEWQAGVWRARALLAVATEDAKTASELYAAASDDSESDIYSGGILALLARTAGLIDEAIPHFEDAQEYFHRSEQRTFEHWNAFWFAETLLMRGSPDDEARARSLLQETLNAAQELGMVLLETRVRKVLEGIPGVSPEGETKVYPDGLTEREVEVLRLIARGLTNKEIGVKLFISVKTVNTHVQHILEKTGMANRAEATAYAIHNKLTE